MRAPEQQTQRFSNDNIDWAVYPSENGPYKKEDIYLIVEFTTPIYTHFSLSYFFNINNQPSYKNVLLACQQFYQPQFKYLHAAQIDILQTTQKGLISFKEFETVHFIRLDKISEDLFIAIFLDHDQNNKLKTGDQIKQSLQKSSFRLLLNKCEVPQSYENNFTVINALSRSNDIGFFDHAVHFQLNTPCEKIKNVHLQISQVYFEYFNLNILKEKPVDENEVIQRMNAIPTHVNSLILKGKVSVSRIIQNIPKHIHEIILSTDFELDGSLSLFVKNIPAHVQQIGIESKTDDIKRLLNYFENYNHASHLRAIRLFQGVDENVIQEIPKCFTTIYLTPDIYVSRTWLEFVLDNLQLKKRDFLCISYPLGLLDLNLFQDEIPYHLSNEKVHFIQHISPEHTPRFIKDKPFNLFIQLLMMPGVKKEALTMMYKTYKNTDFDIMIYPGLDADIFKHLPLNMRSLIFCLPVKTEGDKSLLRNIPDEFITTVNFANGSIPATAEAIEYDKFAQGICIVISEITNIKTMQAFFNRLKQYVIKRPSIESIDITAAKRNKHLLEQIPNALVKETEFKLSTFDSDTLERLATKASYLTFTVATPSLPDNTRKSNYINLISALKKFSHLKVVKFKCKINHQILQGVASVPSVKTIELYHTIKDTDEKSIRKYINVLKVLKDIDTLIFYHNNEFCKKLKAHNLIKTATLKFSIFLDEELLYDPIKHNKRASKKRKRDQFDDADPVSYAQKRQKTSFNLFSGKTEEQKNESDEEDVDIIPEMSPTTQAFMKN